MGEGERVFYKVPVSVRVHCRNPKCNALLEEGDEYYMTDDDSLLYCTKCATGLLPALEPEPAAEMNRVPRRKAEWMEYETR